MSAIYTIQALSNGVARITTGSGRIWSTTSSASVLYNTSNATFTISFDGISLVMTAEQIDNIGGSSPDPEPYVCINQILACFPKVGSVQNSTTELVRFEFTEGSEGTFGPFSNPFNSGAYLTYAITGIVNSPQIDVSLKIYDSYSDSYINVGSIGSATGSLSGGVVYLGATSVGDFTGALSAKLPDNFYLHLVNNGDAGSAGQIVITANYLV